MSFGEWASEMAMLIYWLRDWGRRPVLLCSKDSQIIADAGFRPVLRGIVTPAANDDAPLWSA